MEITWLPWTNLYEHYKGIKCCAAENHRKFKSWTGVHPEVAEFIFNKYQDAQCLPNRTRLLVVLHFLKDMPSEDEGSSRFKISSRNTYRKFLWETIHYLDYAMNEINLEDRFLDHVPSAGIFAGISLVVDGTDCPVDRPQTRDGRNFLSSGRSKENIYGRYNLKYTVACQISSGKICSILGPEGGSVADVTALREGELVAVINACNPLEIILADKGYQGHWKCLTAYKGKDLLPEQEAFNEVLASVRIICECTINRIKKFGVLGSRGRFHCQIGEHKAIFNVSSQITNISLSLQPVWLHTNWYL